MEFKIGEMILKYRKAKGYTQEQLGELVGVSGQAVSKWEKGGIPDASLLPTIARALGVTIDALFDIEKKISDYSENEILDQLHKFCSYKHNSRKDAFNLFEFLFETVWTLQSAYFDSEKRTELQNVVNFNQKNPQVSSQIIDNEGTTYLSLVKDFPFFCAVKDTPEIPKKLLAEKNFSDLFTLLASEEGMRAIIFTQSHTQASHYTAEKMAEKIGITLDRFLKIEPLLIKYGLLNTYTLSFDEKAFKVYHKWSNPEIRMLLMMAYQFINSKQCYYNYACNRSTPYFEE